MVGVFLSSIISFLTAAGILFSFNATAHAEDKLSFITLVSSVCLFIIFVTSLICYPNIRLREHTTDFIKVKDTEYVICLNPTEIKVDNETFIYCKGKGKN